MCQEEEDLHGAAQLRQIKIFDILLSPLTFESQEKDWSQEKEAKRWDSKIL